MIRFWGQTLSVAVLAAAAGSAVPACAHDDASIYVDGVLAPPPPSGNVCIYNPDPTAAHIAQGYVDSALRSDYQPEFLLGSTLIQQGNANTPDSETARVEIQGAIVQVIDPATNETVEDNTVLTSGLIEPAAGSAPSYLATNASIMNKVALDHFAPEPALTKQGFPVSFPPPKIALVNVTFYGVTLGGQSVQSNQYQFPVTVCWGCSVVVPPGAPTGALDYCAGKSAMTTSDIPCTAGQDQNTDCQICYGLDIDGTVPNPACNRTP